MKHLLEKIKVNWGKLPQCDKCSKTLNLKQAMLCGGNCETTFYCNVTCQAKDWAKHYITCIGAQTKRGLTSKKEGNPGLQKKRVVAWRDFTDTKKTMQIWPLGV